MKIGPDEESLSNAIDALVKSCADAVRIAASVAAPPSAQRRVKPC
jgi:hypothetical protein